MIVCNGLNNFDVMFWELQGIDFMIGARVAMSLWEGDHDFYLLFYVLKDL